MAADFSDPHQEWRRLFSELFGTFLLVLVAGKAAPIMPPPAAQSSSTHLSTNSRAATPRRSAPVRQGIREVIARMPLPPVLGGGLNG